MENNMLVKDIAAEFEVYPENKKLYKAFRNQLHHFRTGTKSWVDITSQYNFNDYTGDIRPDSRFRDPEILEMRDMYESGKSYEEIAEKFDITVNKYLKLLIKGYKRKI
jgi:hypothetical protein